MIRVEQEASDLCQQCGTVSVPIYSISAGVHAIIVCENCLNDLTNTLKPFFYKQNEVEISASIDYTGCMLPKSKATLLLEKFAAKYANKARELFGVYDDDVMEIPGYVLGLVQEGNNESGIDPMFVFVGNNGRVESYGVSRIRLEEVQK